MIEFKSIRKSFGPTEVIKGLDFTVESGDLVSLIGLSGSGKSTTLKMINRIIEPTSGSIYIDGVDTKDIDIIELRRNMGYVIQSIGLFPHMTIRENIRLVPELEHLDEEVIEQRLVDLMDMVGLGHEFLDRYPHELSGGQQQRIGIVRAFMLDPDIILMDEPFSALDPITRADLQEQLMEIQQELQKTIVFVTHDMTEAIKISDKVCILDGGTIVQYDTPEEILKNPKNEFIEDFVGSNRIWESPEFIKAKDIMFTNVYTTGPRLPIRRALPMMRAEGVNSLIVIDRATRETLGILKPDIIQSTPQDKRDGIIDDIMIKDYIYANPEDTIIDILTHIQDRNISEVPVIDEDRKLIGLVTKNSLITTMSQQYLGDEI